MTNLPLKPTELNLISRLEYYKWIDVLRDGKLLLENTINKRKVTGKIVPSTSEGELYLRLQLQHQNINRLLEVLCLNDRIKLLISPFIGNSIGTLIHDDNFNKHPKCFDRKKSYAKGILSALSYMHQNSVFHLSLNDENIAVCSKTDKAKLCDFSYAVAQKKVTKQLLPPNRHYPSPEVENGSDSETFDSLPLDIWDCGILLLQIFTQHQLPWRGAVNNSLEFLEDVEILKKTNSGANINGEIASEFRVFIQHLLSQNPDLRPSAKQALQSSFLQTLHNRVDKKVRRFPMSHIIPDSYTEKYRFIESLTGSDIDVIKFTDASCSKSVKPGLISTKSEPDNTLHREIFNPLLPRYGSFNNNLSASDVVSGTDARYPKSDKSCLTRTKSEPDSTWNRGVPHPPLSPRYVSRFIDNLRTSDIDVVNLSDQDDVVNMTDDRYPKSDKPHFPYTKSEPDSIWNREVPPPPLPPGYVSRFIDNLRTSDIDVVNLSDQDDVSMTDARYPETDKPGLTCTKSELDSPLHREVPHSPFPKYANYPSMLLNNDAESSNSEKKFHQCNYLTEWEVEDPLFMKEESNNLLKYYETPDNQKDELPQYPPCSLERITPYIVSIPDVNFSDPLSNLDEWFDIPLENSHEASPLQSQTKSSDKKMKKKKVSITDSLKLIPRNSMSKDLRKYDSPILVDKSDLYKKSETRIAEGRQKIAIMNRLTADQLRSDTNTVRQSKKWYNKLLWCGRQ